MVDGTIKKIYMYTVYISEYEVTTFYSKLDSFEREKEMGNYLEHYATKLPFPPIPTHILPSINYLGLDKSIRPVSIKLIKSHLNEITSDDEEFQDLYLFYIEEIIPYVMVCMHTYVLYTIISPVNNLHKLSLLISHADSIIVASGGMSGNITTHTVYRGVNDEIEVMVALEDEDEVICTIRSLEQLVLWNIAYRDYMSMLRDSVYLGMDCQQILKQDVSSILNI
jgi:hypothetical protein